jgi:endonuclease YncB( thermonuclease family)
LRYRVAFALGLAVLYAAAAQAACDGAPLGGGRVQSVIDGRTLLLADGREVRLAGIEAPYQSKAALEALVAGQDVTLSRIGPDADRYGRTLALATVRGEPIQAALLERGAARVSATIGHVACAGILQNAERKARSAHLGLWADPHYFIRNAGEPGEILAIRGQFAVVEGKILSVRESGGQIYVNFGRRWSDDFTVTVPKRSERSFTAAGLPLKKLAGQRVRVRGWVEERGGPWIEAQAPEQIEIAERGLDGHE